MSVLVVLQVDMGGAVDEICFSGEVCSEAWGDHGEAGTDVIWIIVTYRIGLDLLPQRCDRDSEVEEFLTQALYSKRILRFAECDLGEQSE